MRYVTDEMIFGVQNGKGGNWERGMLSQSVYFCPRSKIAQSCLEIFAAGGMIVWKAAGLYQGYHDAAFFAISFLCYSTFDVGFKARLY